VKIVAKPWGSERWLFVNKQYAAKIITVNKGHKFSLQYHRRKHESWYFYKGEAKVTLGKKVIIAKSGRIIDVKPKAVHRVEGITKAQFFEVSTPELKDVVRLEDDYGRSTIK